MNLPLVRALLATLVALMLAGCAGAPSGVGPTQAIDSEGFPALSRCALMDLAVESEGVRTPDPEFERANRALEWRFEVAKSVLRSQRQAAGVQAIVFEVPVVSLTKDALVAEGPVPVDYGKLHKRVEIKRQPDAKGRLTVIQTRTLKTPAGTPGTLMPFHKWRSVVVTWMLACESAKTG